MGIKMIKSFFVVLIVAAPLTSFAQVVKTEVAATNGVMVTVNSDSFSGRNEYTSPEIRLSLTGPVDSIGYAYVAKTSQGGVVGVGEIQGGIVYNGTWQHFNAAVFRGGEVVDYKKTGETVVDCRNGCTLNGNCSPPYGDGVARVGQTTSEMA